MIDTFYCEHNAHRLITFKKARPRCTAVCIDLHFFKCLGTELLYLKYHYMTRINRPSMIT